MNGLFGTASPQGFTPLTIGGDVLAGWYQAKASALTAGASGPQLSGASTGGYAGPVDQIVPPWDVAAKSESSEELARAALADGVFFDPKTLSGYSDIDAPDDYKKLFGLHQAVKTLWAIASEAADKTTTDFRRSFLDKRYQEGITQINAFLSKDQFDSVDIFASRARDKIESEIGVKRGVSEYVTPVLHEGAFDAEVAGFTGAAQFTITIRKNSVDTPVAIDLSEMTQTRSLDNVADFINAKLEAAGGVTRLKREKIGVPDEDGVVQGDRYGFKISGVSTETLVFSAPDAAPALFLVGSSGGTSDAPVTAGQVTKLSDLDAAAPGVAASRRLEAVEGAENGIEIIDAKASADGGFFALAETDASIDGGAGIRGEKDAVLVKYDSTGRMVWSRALGAASAEGLSLGVTDAGEVVIGGAIEGAFGDTIATGGADAFAAKYSANGAELWVKRFGGAGDEQVNALTVDASGAIYLAGVTQSALGGSSGGGRDGFVRALSDTGATMWTRQFGGAGDEAASAIALADDGSLLVGAVEDGAGAIYKFTSANGDDPAAWSYSLGDLDSGSIGAIAVDGTDIYVAGAARSGMDGTGALTAHSDGGRDGFLVKLADGVAPTENYRTFLGSVSEDVVSDVEVHNGAVYLSGRTDGALPGGGELVGERNAFVTRIDAATGAVSWTEQVSGRGGKSAGAAIAIDFSGASSLDRFGFPSGALSYTDSTVIADRTSARSGDFFYVRVDGGAKRKIAIDADDTLRALSFKVEAVLGLKGKADVSRLSSGDKLKIEAGAGHSIELIAGPQGSDLLSALGLKAGVVQKAPEVDPDSDEAKALPARYSLKLDDAASIAGLDDASSAKAILDKAMSEIRRAYREASQDPAEKEALERARALNGPAPEYLTAKIAAYQDALLRLGGGF